MKFFQFSNKVLHVSENEIINLSRTEQRIRNKLS